jgi:FAD:protein FMN transferase
MRLATRAGRSMGSPLRLTTRVAQLDAAWTAVIDTFQRAEHDLTRFDVDSPLSRLNAAAGGGWRAIPPLLAAALAAAHRAYRTSAGIFDPRVIGALERAGEHAGVVLPASPAEFHAEECWLRLDIRRGLAALDAPIDLGGIGKGLALRRAARAVRRMRVANFLIEIGGDIVVAGAPPAGGDWMVAIEQPQSKDPAAVVGLRDCAIATSSIAVRSWVDADGQPAHHLIDPRTGHPARGDLISVTVVASDPVWAEVWSKVAFIRPAGITPGRPAWCIGTYGALAMTAAARQRTRWQRVACT